MTGFLTNRFTAEMHIRVPAGYRVIGSGSSAQPHSTPKASSSISTGPSPAFPEPSSPANLTSPSSVAAAATSASTPPKRTSRRRMDYAADRQQQFAFFTSHLRHPAVQPPEYRRTARRHRTRHVGARNRRDRRNRIGDKSNGRLLANTIAHQWWGSQVSPGDAERCVDHQRHVALRRADVHRRRLRQNALSVRHPGRLRRSARLRHRFRSSTAGRLSPFSPEFQSMTLEKGAMVFHMLRWEVGDEIFKKILQAAFSRNTPVSPCAPPS